MDLKTILAILDKNIDQMQLAKDLLKEVVLPQLDALAAKSETKVDDAAMAVVKSVLEKLLY
jgi:hypothetical protein